MFIFPFMLILIFMSTLYFNWYVIVYSCTLFSIFMSLVWVYFIFNSFVFILIHILMLIFGVLSCLCYLFLIILV